MWSFHKGSVDFKPFQGEIDAMRAVQYTVDNNFEKKGLYLAYFIGISARLVKIARHTGVVLKALARRGGTKMNVLVRWSKQTRVCRILCGMDTTGSDLHC